MTRRLTTRICCALTLTLIAGCGERALRADSAVMTADGTDQLVPIAKAGHDDLFGQPRILTLAITIASQRLEALKQNEDSHEYVTCAVREGKQTWDDVGLRCRGKPAKELGSGKPDLILTFDKFASRQRFHGQRRVILQSSRDDPSYLAAPVAMEMFREADVPAPRCNFARVELNGKPLGLYVLMEGVEREFIQQHFRRADGNLYDEGHPPDITGKLEKASGRDRKNQSDADALAAAALQSDPSERWNQLQQRLDMNRFLNFTALEVLLWQDDSYALEARKFRLYHDPASDRMVFFPKAVERVLDRTDGPVLPDCKGVVSKAVLTTPEGARRYRETVKRLLVTVFNPAKVQERNRELVAALRSAVMGDNPKAATEFDAAVSRFHEAVAKRAAFAAQQLNASEMN